MKQNMIVTIVVVAAFSAASFFVGMKYQQMKTQSSRTSSANGQRQFQGRGGGAGGRPVAGEILKTDSQSMTVKLTDGSSKIVLLSDKTTISKATEGSKDDLKSGVRVAAFGTENSDGSLTAANVQLNPTFGGGMGGRALNQAPKSADAREIVVEGSNYAFSPSTVTVKKGEKVRILFKNKGGMHDFRIDALNIATAIVQDGQEDFVEFTPDKIGTYEYSCSIGNHKAMGMKGTMTVE